MGWQKVAGGKWVGERSSKQAGRQAGRKASYDPGALEREIAVSEKFNTRKQALLYKSGLKR